MKLLNLFRHWEDVEEYRARSIIYSERDPADVLYFILSGEVELSLQGKTLNIEKEGGIIGEMALFSSATRNATATALTKVKLARMDCEQFRQLIGKNPEFSLHAMAVLANRLRAVDHYISTHMEHNS